MEEEEEAGYRSPTWRLLRALQQVNKATRIGGETIMSAPPFFESASRGDLTILGRSNRTNGGYLRKPVEVGKNELVEQNIEHFKRLGRVV